MNKVDVISLRIPSAFRMKGVIFVSVLIIATVLAQKCKPKYHFWRPYNGTIPNDAFLAGVDEDGRRNYVAKIIPLDEYLWTIPAQFKEGCDHVDLSWCCNDGRPDRKVMRVDRFIEILCVDNPENLQWVKVDRYADEIENCCLVEGGIALFSNHIYVPYIGKGVVDGVNFIGRAYMERAWEGVHVMDGGNSTKVYRNFEMLSYDCKENGVIPPAKLQLK
ncbi:hypothetical protein HHI36_010158 [Cryptolaemus montrouzieri]|uniref:Uncharacterized protein n=1 Tax=Cryptolaemus montrouzieri TaxID=559131 RepID=A0ABD2MHY3_9CUCU